MAEQKGALEKSERDLRFAMPRNVASGLDAVERLVKEQVRPGSIPLNRAPKAWGASPSQGNSWLCNCQSAS